MRHTGSRIAVDTPQSNAIVERLHRRLLDGHFSVEGRRTWFGTIEEMQLVLDGYMDSYNEHQPHQGQRLDVRTPAQAFLYGLPNRASQQQENAKRQKRTSRKATQRRGLTRLSGAALSAEYRLVHTWSATTGAGRTRQRHERTNTAAHLCRSLPQPEHTTARGERQSVPAELKHAV